MKKVIRTIAAVAMLMATTSVMSNELKLASDGTSKSLVFEWNAQSVETSIKIEDQNGNIIFSDDIVEVETYVKKFDLTSLPQGEYFLKVENVLREVVYFINVNKTDVSIVGEEENLKPIYREENDKVYLNLLNLDRDVIEVSVLDSEYRSLFNETIEDIATIEKVFNFKNAIKDDYTIVINDGENTFYKTISVK